MVHSQYLLRQWPTGVVFKRNIWPGLSLRRFSKSTSENVSFHNNGYMNIGRVRFAKRSSCSYGKHHKQYTNCPATTNTPQHPQTRTRYIGLTYAVIMIDVPQLYSGAACRQHKLYKNAHAHGSHRIRNTRQRHSSAGERTVH